MQPLPFPLFLQAMVFICNKSLNAFPACSKQRIACSHLVLMFRSMLTSRQVQVVKRKREEESEEEESEEEESEEKETRCANPGCNVLYDGGLDGLQPTWEEM